MTEKGQQNKFGICLFYVIFLFGFLLGGGVVRVGMEILNTKGFEWFILVVLVFLLSPIAYLYIREE